MELTPEQIETIAEKVVAKIRSTHILTERSFNFEMPDDFYWGRKNNELSHSQKQEKYRKITDFVSNIVVQVCDYYRVHTNIAFAHKRRKYIISKLARELPEEPISYSVLAKVFGKKTHNSVMVYLETFDKEYKNNEAFRKEYFEIKTKVEQSLKL